MKVEAFFANPSYIKYIYQKYFSEITDFFFASRSKQVWKYSFISGRGFGGMILDQIVIFLSIVNDSSQKKNSHELGEKIKLIEKYTPGS